MPLINGYCQTCGAQESNCECGVGGNPNSTAAEINDFRLTNGLEPVVVRFVDGRVILQALSISRALYEQIMSLPKEGRLDLVKTAHTPAEMKARLAALESPVCPD